MVLGKQSAGNMAATSAAAQVAPGSSPADNLGKYFMVAQGLTALMGVAGGFSGAKAASTEADALNAEADLALSEARREANMKANEVKSFRETQAQAYNSSGVILDEGTSPMAVLADTVRKGNEEIDAILKRGEAVRNLYRAKAKQTKSAGTAGLLTSVLGAGAGLAAAALLGKKIGLFGGGGGSNPLPGPAPAPSGPGIGGTDVSLPPIIVGGKKY